MCYLIAVVQQRDDSVAAAFLFIILLITVIGFLMSEPPERPYQTFICDHKKTQYISIGANNDSSST